MQALNLTSPITGKVMTPVTLEVGLRAYQCEDSGGHYIPAASYMQWLGKQPARLPHLPESGSNPEIDSNAALLCPETGTLMARLKVGHGFPFTIDRSITGGIWLDAGEWEALKQRNFHDEIHLVFTLPWQKQVRTRQAQDAHHARLEVALGKELLQRIESLREDLGKHPHRSLALAFRCASCCGGSVWEGRRGGRNEPSGAHGQGTRSAGTRRDHTG